MDETTPVAAAPESTPASSAPTLNDASAALAYADSSFADPAADAAPTASSPEPASVASAATEPAAEPVSAQLVTDKKHEPFVPYDRFNEVNESKKSLEAKLKDLEWAATLTPDDRQHLLNIRQALTTNPAEFIAQAWHLLENDPQHAPALKSQAARLLASRQAPAEEAPQPDAAIQLPDGSTVPTYTPDGMKAREAWFTKQLTSQIRAQLTQEFQPLAATADQLRHQQQAAERQQQTTQWAIQSLAPYKHLPDFAEHAPAIQKALTDVPEGFTGDLEQVVRDAYAQSYAAKLDRLSKTGQAQALASLQQRAVAGTGNPAAASTVTPPKVLGDARAALQMAFADGAA